MDKCNALMGHFTEEVEILDHRQIMARAIDAMGLKEFNLLELTPTKALEIYCIISEKFRRHKQEEGELNWWENQLRLFVWILCCYLHIRKTRIELLQQSDYEFFGRFFPNKKFILFEYQVMSLNRDGIPHRRWEEAEDNLFRELVQQRGQKYKWSELAKELYIESDRTFFRTPKQCRERWLNHLDPKKSKQEWEAKEDFVLISHVIQNGKKWAEISKKLKNRRNEHSIKNRFKSLITKEEKSHSSPVSEQKKLESLYQKYSQHFARQEPRIEPATTSTLEKPPSMFDIPGPLQQLPEPQQAQEPQQVPEPVLPSFNSFASIAEVKDRERQVRAEMFLCSDPFIFLRQFFRSRDWEQLQN